MHCPCNILPTAALCGPADPMSMHCTKVMRTVKANTLPWHVFACVHLRKHTHLAIEPVAYDPRCSDESFSHTYDWAVGRTSESRTTWPCGTWVIAGFIRSLAHCTTDMVRTVPPKDQLLQGCGNSMPICVCARPNFWHTMHAIQADW